MNAETETASREHQSPSNTYALLIGINCYKPHSLPNLKNDLNLQGAVNDIERFEQEILKAVFELSPENILKLTSSNPNPHLKMPVEASEKLATYRNIVAQFKALTAMAESGDHVYIYYSGHGKRVATVIPEVKGSEGKDESLVPADIGQEDESGAMIGQYLRDIEIAKLLSDMAEKGLVVTAIFDCCHAGGTTRGPARVRGDDAVDTTRYSTESIMTAKAELVDNWRSLTKASEPLNTRSGLQSSWLPESNRYLMLAACCANESAYEDVFDLATRKANGAFTYRFLEALQQGYDGLTYKDLMGVIGAKVSAGFHQTPIALGASDRVVFGAQKRYNQPTVIVTRVQASVGRVTLAAGQAVGIRHGTKFAIYPNGTRDFTQTENQLAIATVVEYDATHAICELIPEQDKPTVVQGDQAILVAPAAQLMRTVQMDETPNASVEEQKALAAVEVAVEPIGKGWLKVASHHQSIGTDAERHSEQSSEESSLNERDYFVAVEDQHYQICRRSGAAYENMRPPIAISDPDGPNKVVKRLIHLAKYQAAKELNNARSPIVNKLDVSWLGTTKYYDPLDPIPSPANLNPVGNIANVPENNWVFLRIHNQHSSDLNIAVIEFSQTWQIQQVYPAHPNENFVTLAKGESETIAFQLYLPEGYSTSTSIVKVFATVGAPNLRWLQLPPLDEPVQKATPRSLSSGDDLELLLSAIGQEKPAARMLETASTYRHWGTKELSVIAIKE